MRVAIGPARTACRKAKADGASEPLALASAGKSEAALPSGNSLKQRHISWKMHSGFHPEVSGIEKEIVSAPPREADTIEVQLPAGSSCPATLPPR